MVDAIVIGGGIVGISAAYHLVREGVRTLLVDRRDAGRATDAGAGIITPGGERRTCRRSARSGSAPPDTQSGGAGVTPHPGRPTGPGQ